MNRPKPAFRAGSPTKCNPRVNKGSLQGWLDGHERQPVP